MRLYLLLKGKLTTKLQFKTIPINMYVNTNVILLKKIMKIA